MYASAQAAAEKTPPDPNAHLVEDFHKIGITESHLHLWASRGPTGGAKEGPLLSHPAVIEAARARRGGGSGSGDGGATVTAVGETNRSVESSPFSRYPAFFFVSEHVESVVFKFRRCDVCSVWCIMAWCEALVCLDPEFWRRDFALKFAFRPKLRARMRLQEVVPHMTPVRLVVFATRVRFACIE